MSVTEEQRKKNIKFMAVYISIVITFLATYAFGYIGNILDTTGISIFGAVLEVYERVMRGEIFYAITKGAAIGMGLSIPFGGIVYFFVCLDNQRHYTYKLDEIAGTGGFMSEKERKEYEEKYISSDPEPITNYPIPIEDWETQQEHYSKNMIASNTFCRPINSRRIMGNNNTLVEGGAGTGKSRYYIKPNILQMNASYIITDPSGEMIYSVGKVLSDNGYRIKIFNISDMAHSNCYNPLNYIRDEAGVNMLISILIDNTTKGEVGGDNQFFVDAEKLLYSACIFYLIDFCHDERQKNFSGVVNMINSSSVDEMNANAKSPLDKLFDKLPHDSLAWKYYKAFKQAAGKTLKSIIISCVTRLQPFMTPQVVNLTRMDDLNLETLGDIKTALFIITPQADRTYSFLASMLYSQLFETLYYVGEQQKANGGDEQLKIPVRCLMDEFANIGEVPEFPSKLSTMRKYNISATIVVQDIAQLEARYKDDWKTLVGNCSTIVFLGTQEPNTLKYFSEMLGKTTVRSRSTGISEGRNGSSNKNYQYTSREVLTPDELGRLPTDECIIFTQSMRPVRDKKYKYENHPYYPQTADANPEYGFEYNKMSVFDNTRAGKFSSILIAQREAARFRAQEKDRKFTKTDETKIMGDPNNLANQFDPNENIREKVYRECIIECQERAIDFYGDTVCMFQISRVPAKYLPRLVTQTMAALQKEPILIFTGIENKSHLIYGIAKGNNMPALKSAMQNDMVKEIKESDGYIIVVINENFYEKYRKSVLNSYKREGDTA